MSIGRGMGESVLSWKPPTPSTVHVSGCVGLLGNNGVTLHGVRQHTHPPIPNAPMSGSVGLWGDMVVTLNDGSKVEMRAVPR